MFEHVVEPEVECVPICEHEYAYDLESECFVVADDTLPRGRDSTFRGEMAFDQTGRSSLVTYSTIWSLVYYGTAITEALDLTGSQATGAYTLMGGAGFLLPFYLTRSAEVPSGAATMAAGGMFQGALHGWMLGGLLFGSELDSRLGWGMSASIGIAETVAGFLIAKDAGIGDGEATLINTSMFYGTAFGALGAVSIANNSLTEPTYLRLVTGLGLAGAVGGVLVANSFRQSTRVNTADAAVFSTATAIAAVAPLTVLLASRDNVDGTTLSVSTMIAIAGGMGVGAVLIHGVDHPDNGAAYYPLGAVAGAVMGYGFGELLRAERWTPPVMVVGAAAGLAIVIASQEARDELRSFGSLEFDINPFGALLAHNMNVPVPVARMLLRF